MKILTKEWVKKYELVRLIGRLKRYDADIFNFEQIKEQSKNGFFSYIKEDEELSKLAFSSNLAQELYDAHIFRSEQTLRLLPQLILNKIKDFKVLSLGYANKEDLKILNEYAKKIYKELEEKANKASDILLKVQSCLSKKIDFELLTGNLVYEERSNGSDYYINVDGHIVVIENYQIEERENCKINEWDYGNPVSCWTNLEAVELYNLDDKNLELHLLLANGDRLENKTYWYFTLSGTNVKIV